DAAERDAGPGAELRPVRLDVAHPPEVGGDAAFLVGLLVAGQLVAGAAGANRRERRLGGKPAGADRVVGALDARHVDEAGGAADQRPAGEGELRHRLVAALGDGTRAVADAPGALEHAADRRVGLEALE